MFAVIGSSFRDGRWPGRWREAPRRLGRGARATMYAPHVPPYVSEVYVALDGQVRRMADDAPVPNEEPYVAGSQMRPRPARPKRRRQPARPRRAPVWPSTASIDALHPRLSVANVAAVFQHLDPAAWDDGAYVASIRRRVLLDAGLPPLYLDGFLLASPTP